MQFRGKPKNVTVVAIARELAGFMWAIENNRFQSRIVSNIRVN